MAQRRPDLKLKQAGVLPVVRSTMLDGYRKDTPPGLDKACKAAKPACG